MNHRMPELTMSNHSFHHNNHQANFDLLEDWFEECDRFSRKNDLDDDQLEKLVEILNDDELTKQIYQILENSNYHEQYLEETCKHLFKLYLSKNERLQVFVLSFLPILIAVNLINSLDAKLKLNYNFVDVFLIGLYNFSLINEDGTIKERSFRLPSLNKSSIYHFPEVNSNLSEIAIRKLDQCYKENRIVYVLDNVDRHYLNATNRLVVYCNLVQIYYDSISLLGKQALFAFCRACNSMLFHNAQGAQNGSTPVPDSGSDLDKPIDYLSILKRCKPKPQFSSNFFLQLLNCLYFCIYNGAEKEGRGCIVEIHNRAKSSLFTDVLLMTNAIFNSLSISKQSLENDECMGINISLSPNSEISTGPTKKSAITNASFKTQKLPDDIPIKISENQENLAAIGEEMDEQNVERNERAGRSYVSQQQLQQQQSSQNPHLASVKLTTKDNLNGFASSKHSKEKEKKDKKKKRTKSSNQDDVNMQILSASLSESAASDGGRALFKISSQTKSNQHLNNDFLLESMKLINEPNERKTNQAANNSDALNEEQIPLV